MQGAFPFFVPWRRRKKPSVENGSMPKGRKQLMGPVQGLFKQLFVNMMAMRTHLIIASLLSSVLMPCCSKLQPESERRPESYTSAFHLSYITSPFNYEYLIPVAHNSISKEDVLGKVSGQGWKTTAIYQLNMDKEVVKEFVLVTGNSISTARNETFPSNLIFSADGQSVSFYEFNGDETGRYETDPFFYDASNNAITLPIEFGSWGGNGRLIYLSSETMVCVCTHEKDWKGEELIFMEVLQRVSAAERKYWVDRCPNYGVRI